MGNHSVKLPIDQDLTFGQMYNGSRSSARWRPAARRRGFNPGGNMYMWHSHNEKEIVNNNIFPRSADAGAGDSLMEATC